MAYESAPGDRIYVQVESKAELNEYRGHSDTWDDAMQAVLAKAAKYDEERNA